MDEHFGTTDIFHNYWQLKFLIYMIWLLEKEDYVPNVIDDFLYFNFSTIWYDILLQFKSSLFKRKTNHFLSKKKKTNQPFQTRKTLVFCMVFIIANENHRHYVINELLDKRHVSLCLISLISYSYDPIIKTAWRHIYIMLNYIMNETLAERGQIGGLNIIEQNHIREKGRTHISRLPVVGRGNVTSNPSPTPSWFRCTRSIYNSLN